VPQSPLQQSLFTLQIRVVELSGMHAPPVLDVELLVLVLVLVLDEEVLVVPAVWQ
jgi:hypothetical protein